MSLIITEIKVKLASGKTLELTPAEARELHGELRKLFELEEPVVPLSPFFPNPTYPPYPIVIERCPDTQSPFAPWAVTYNSNDFSCEATQSVLLIGRHENE